MTIEKLDPATPDLTRQNIEGLLELFPECRTEGSRNDAPMVDFDLLRQALSDYLVEGPAERYRLDWPGKRQALLTANTPIEKTLRPMRDESVDFDTTRNLFIEGDNLDALKLLQETYLGKVKMIYIDPPYNTGNDFIYKDNFSQSREDYEEQSQQRDITGGRLVANPESNGRFHSDWLSMTYARLKVARNFLSDDGVIFISIDDNEFSSLKHLCDEIFGHKNLIGVLKWNKTSKAPTLSKKLRNKYEFVLLYEKVDCHYLKGPDSYNTMAPLFNSGNPRSKITFPAGTIEFGFEDQVLSAGEYGKGDKKVTLHEDLEISDGRNANQAVLTARFKWSQATVDERTKAGQSLAFKTNKLTTMYYSLEPEGSYIAPSDLLNKDECGVLRNDEGYTDLTSMFDGLSPFDYAKPSSLIRYFCRMVDDPEAIVFDFFAGSATAAQAVLEANAEDGGTRQFIVVQLPEEIPEDSPVRDAGFGTISEFARERIRLASQRLEAKGGKLCQNFDAGFRALRIDSGNFYDASVTPKKATQEALAGMISHIKEDRSEEDLLFGALLRWGVDITLPIEQRGLAGRTVWLVDSPEDGSAKGSALIACFAKPGSGGNGGIDTELADAMAELAPLRVLFRDDGFADDATKENVHSRFKQLAPDTQVRVL